MMLREVKNAWRDYFSLTAVQALLVPLGIAAIALTTRILGPRKYGVLALFLSVTQLIYLLGMNWTTPAIIRFGKEEFLKKKNIQTFFGSRLVLVVVNSILIFLILLLFQGPILHYIGIAEWMYWLFYAMLLALIFSNDVSMFLQSFGLMRQYAFSQAVEKAVYLLLVTLLFFLFPTFRYFTLIAFFMIGAKMAVVFYSLLHMKARYFFPMRLSRSILLTILAYSWPLIPTYFSGYLSNWIDLFIIRYYLSFEEVGIYQVAYQGMLYLSGVLMVLSTLLFPLLISLRTRKGVQWLRPYLTQLTPQMVIFWNIIFPLVILFASPVFQILFGKEFLGGVIPFTILIGAIALQTITVMYSPIFSVFDLLKQSFVIHLIMTILNIVGDILLVPKMGISGAALATLLSYAFAAYAYLFYINKKFGIRQYGTALYPFFTLTSVFSVFFLPSFLTKAVGVLVLLALFLVLIKKNHIFAEKDLELLKRVEMPEVVRRHIQKLYHWLS